jgi:hypothetical protein
VRSRVAQFNIRTKATFAPACRSPYARGGLIALQYGRCAARSVCLVFAASLLCSCATSTEKPAPVARTAQQIANVYVSAYPDVPWADISASLSPARGWKITDAQQLAANATAAQSFLVSSLFAASLGINAPTVTNSPASTAATPAPAAVTAGTTTTPGVIPTLPALPTLAQPTTPPTVASPSTLSPVDGSELLVTSTALFQQAAIIDNQISKQYIPRGYVPHLITFQINLQPTSPDWSYDAFVDVTLIPSPFGAAVTTSAATHQGLDGLPPVMVKPLIITDALETSSVQRSVQQIRQALLQLSGSIGTTGAAGGAGYNRLSQIGLAGYDKNSLVTAGRVTDATIRIRLGAGYSGSSYPTLIPRTYNVSLFVLMRNQPIDGSHDRQPSQLAAITHTFFLPARASGVNGGGKQFTDPEYGYVKSASFRDRRAIATSVRKVVDSFGYEPLVDDCAISSSTGDDDSSGSHSKESLDTYLDFLRAVDRGDYVAIKKCLRIRDDAVAQDVETLYRLISSLSELQVTTLYSRLAIPLKDVFPELPDERQLALVTDNADSGQETVTLRGGRNLSGAQVDPAALLSFSDGRMAWLKPIQMSYTADSLPPKLEMVFPSPGTLGPVTAAAVPASTDPAAPPSAQLQGIRIELKRESADGPDTLDTAWYSHLAKVATTTGKTATSGAACATGQKPISTTATVVRQTDVGSGGTVATLNVTAGDLAKIAGACSQTFGGTSTPTLSQPFWLVVTGADPTPDGTCFTMGKRGIQLKTDGQCTGVLQLHNLTPEVPLTLSVTDGTTAIGSPLSLRVIESGGKH